VMMSMTMYHDDVSCQMSFHVILVSSQVVMCHSRCHATLGTRVCGASWTTRSSALG
jgi:hypothetical protein